LARGAGQPSAPGETAGPFPADWESTRQIPLPRDPLARVIGQDRAVELARLCARQRRHLLLVGPPGTGKSMIAQALALHLKPPMSEVLVVRNPANADRPFVEVRTREEIEEDRAHREAAEGDLIAPEDAPAQVAERLGYMCANCKAFSSADEPRCPSCNRPKLAAVGIEPGTNPFGDLLGNIFTVTLSQMGPEGQPKGRQRVKTTHKVGDREEVVVFERAGDQVRRLDERTLERRRAVEERSQSKVIVPLSRTPFVLATGASETELLGDVRHDPYGGHPQLGSEPYTRVTAGAIHEAHEGVLFIDELPTLGHLQRHILTAMQERRFPIAGRHPQSAGASTRVDDVPCNFVLVAACNIQDLPSILSPLRSRVAGEGYEVLVETTMPDTQGNRRMLAQFAAQEVTMDRRIPHASRAAVDALIAEAARRAREGENQKGALTLRLRELGGVVRAAGDLAVDRGDDLIEPRHIEEAIRRARPIEEQIKDRYGSYVAGLAKDVMSAQKQPDSPYNYWNWHEHDDHAGYE
jgi:ATP-dependent Lon protease